MTSPILLFFDEIQDSQIALVGPKGGNLARLARAGLRVPPGFVITSTTFANRAQTDVSETLRAAYRKLGSGPVAVRSSALAEDTGGSSFAGQQETFLDVIGEDALLDAVRACWDSIFSERAVAYRNAMGLGEEAVAMAVVVQQMARAEVAGVLFTRDPTDANAERMLAEASWGLGEAIVSGLVTPDRWTLDRATGKPLDTVIARKHVQITEAGEGPVPAEKQMIPCLSEDALQQLAELGRKVEAEYGQPQDIEWAWAQNQMILLQSRPITSSVDERAAVRQEEIAALKAIAESEGTIWARYSVAEVLPEPLPFTWTVWSQFMSGGGGYGKMYRELGFDPDPALEKTSVLDLIAGRPYFNLSRDIKLYYRNNTSEYPFAKFKQNPELAIYPMQEANPEKAPKGFFQKLSSNSQVVKTELKLEMAMNEAPAALEKEHFPRMKAWAQEWRNKDLSRLSDKELLDSIQATRTKIFDEYLPQSLKPSVFAGASIGKLQMALTPLLGDSEAKATVDALMAGAAPDAEYDLAGGLRDLSEGKSSQSEFLEKFGHRGSGEMELSSPRWRETPGSLPVGAGTSKTTTAHSTPPTLEGLLAGKKANVKQIAMQLERARRFTAMRETSKHCLMLGYEVLRLLLLELDKRKGLNGGIFYLEPQELNALLAGEDLRSRISERRRRRSLALGLEAPRVIFSDDLDAIGRSLPPLDAKEALSGTGVSSGSSEGVALVLRSPEQAPADAQDFILVCPSTDPGWVPLFLRARGVVLETGGVLSHGAIVAREFGLPAVANIADACARFQNGQKLRVDGSEGKVWLLS